MTYYLPGMGGRPRDTADEDERDRTFNELIGGLAAPAADELGSDPVPKLQVQNFDPAPEAPAEYGAHASPPPSDPPVPSDMEDPPTRVEMTGRSMQDETPPPTPPPMAAPAGGAVPRSKYADLEDLLASRAEDNIRNPKSAADTSYHEPTEGSTNWAGMLAPLAAIALDAGVNHGRGAGQIVGAAGANYDADRRQQLQHAERLAEIDARKRADKSTDPLTQLTAFRQQDRLAEQLATVQQPRVALATTAQEAKLDPNSTAAKGAVTQTYNKSYSGKEANLDASHDVAPRTADDRATSLGLGRQAIADVDHTNAPRKSEDKAADIEITTPAAAARSGAQAEAGVAPKEEVIAFGQDHAKGLKGGAVRIPGSVVDDDAAYGAAIANPAQRIKAEDSVGGALALDQSLSKMQEIRKRVGIEPFASNDKTQYDLAYGNAIGAITKLYNSGVLNEAEYARYKESIPTLSPHMSDAKDRILGLFVDGKQDDTVMSQLQGFQKESRELAGARSRPFGYHVDYDGTGAANGGGPKTYTVTDPAGNTYQKPMDDKLRARVAGTRGWSVSE